MKQKRILLESVEDVKEFVAAASRCSFDIDIFYNRMIIDGKSVLGVMSLDLRRVLTVEFNGTDQEFEDYLDSKAPTDSEVA